jgi:hypothetical protein
MAKRQRRAGSARLCYRSPMWRPHLRTRARQVFFGFGLLLATAVFWYTTSALFLWASAPPLETTGALPNGAPEMVEAEPQ